MAASFTASLATRRSCSNLLSSRVSSAPAAASVASCSLPTSPSIWSEPKSAAKKALGSAKEWSPSPSRPLWSYLARRSGSDNTWYASPIFWNVSFAFGSSGFLSGWHVRAFR